MNSLTLSTLATWLGTKFSGSDASLTGMSIDTRTLAAGELYVALKGSQVDGHAFIQEAEAKGASGVLVSENICTTLPVLQVEDTLQALGQLAKSYRVHFELPIVAVTGSCGKTSVKDMLSHILSVSDNVLATQGNLNTEIGVPLTLFKLNASYQSAVIEMGARKLGDIAYLMNIAFPTVSILTNAGIAHVEIFGSEESLAKAKGEIFQYLDTGGIAVINQDDKHSQDWKKLLKGQQLITFGIEKEADIMAKDIKDTCFELATDIGTIPIQLAVEGKHNVMNALTAAAGARALKRSLEDIQTGLEQFKGVAGRLESKQGLSGACILDDTYNANPVSVRAALAVLSEKKGQKICVLGDMKELGRQAARLHYQVGVEAKQRGIELLYCMGELTRHTVDGYGVGAKYYANKDDLIQDLRLLLNPESVVLIKGSRSMQMEEIVRALC